MSYFNRQLIAPFFHVVKDWTENQLRECADAVDLRVHKEIEEDLSLIHI